MKRNNIYIGYGISVLIILIFISVFFLIQWGKFNFEDQVIISESQKNNFTGESSVGIINTSEFLADDIWNVTEIESQVSRYYVHTEDDNNKLQALADYYVVPINKEESSLFFSGSVDGYSEKKGSFEYFDGEFLFNATTNELIGLQAGILMSSVHTGNDLLDRFLKGMHVLHINQYGIVRIFGAIQNGVMNTSIVRGGPPIVVSIPVVYENKIVTGDATLHLSDFSIVHPGVKDDVNVSFKLVVR